MVESFVYGRLIGSLTPRQIRRLVEFLHERLAVIAPLEYVEDVQPDEDVDAPLPGPMTDAPREFAPIRVREPEPKPVSEGELLAGVGDLVTYAVQTPNGEEQVTIQIVDTASNLQQNLANEASPLAQALVGLCSGDETQLVVRGHEPKQLRVVTINRPGFGAGAVR